MLNSIHKKEQKPKKNEDKNGKALYKLLNNDAFGKTMENWRNKIDVRIVNNKKDYLTRTLKPSYMPQKIFDND